VGSFYFLFVWVSEVVMSRSMLDAKLGVEGGERLAEIAAGGGRQKKE
jgi:hypothetical protein